MRTIQLHESWLSRLNDQFEQEYMQKLRDFLLTRKQHRAIIYPPGAQIFNALNSTPFDQVRVVILGQDPYHGPGQAHGLCFSVGQGINPPPSLKNIYKELKSDIGKDIPESGDLSHWAKQGVLLLNATLTVRANQAGSHQNRGWETFTNSVIQMLSARKENIVFILWGAYAQKKEVLIDSKKHCIIKSPHPSPFSAASGFFGSKPFSRTNTYLLEKDLPGIDW